MELTIPQTDALLFPGPGGKSGQAFKYCKTCPVRALCLQEAIENDLDGFMAGTTKDERRHMAVVMKVKVVPLITALPDEPKKKAVQVVVVPDSYAWLDEIQDFPTRVPDEEGLIRL